MINELLIDALRKKGESDFTCVPNDGYIFLRKRNGGLFDKNFIVEQDPDKMRDVCVKLYFEYKKQPGLELRLFFLDNKKNRTLVRHMFFDTNVQIEVDFLDEESIQLIPWIKSY